MNAKKLATVEQFEEAIAEQPTCILFKHSLTCPISQGAFEQFQVYREEHADVPAFYVYVQEARPVSNAIAEHFGVRHESPQVLYIQDGKVSWHESHWKITKQSLQEHID